MARKTRGARQPPLQILRPVEVVERIEQVDRYPGKIEPIEQRPQRVAGAPAHSVELTLQRPAGSKQIKAAVTRRADDDRVRVTLEVIAGALEVIGSQARSVGTHNHHGTVGIGMNPAHGGTNALAEVAPPLTFVRRRGRQSHRRR